VPHRQDDRPISRAAGFDRIASAQRVDDTLDTTAVLAHVPSKKEELIGSLLRGQTWRGMLLPGRAPRMAVGVQEKLSYFA
jgi:hypothetical protein